MSLDRRQSTSSQYRKQSRPDATYAQPRSQTGELGFGNYLLPYRTLNLEQVGKNKRIVDFTSTLFSGGHRSEQLGGSCTGTAFSSSCFSRSKHCHESASYHLVACPCSESASVGP